ncbi:MAG: HNH endonuclease signature motif containing protein [Paraclostridium sp.]
MKNIKYEGYTFKDYKISDDGDVYNKSGDKLKPWDDGRGYLIVDIMRDNKPVRIKIHVASAETHIGKRPNGKIVQHKDGNKKNNSKSNLSYISQKENVAHAQTTIKGKEYLSEEKVSKINNMLKTMGIKEVSDKMKLSYHIVRDIKNNKTYN